MLNTSEVRCLEALEGRIAKLNLDAHEPSTIEENTSFMKTLVKDGIPEQLVNDVLLDPTLLKTVASRSYEHVNHFSKIVLVDNPNTRGYRLTMHIWTSDQAHKAQKEELIHDHRFSFWSHIFTGEMISENFREAKEHSFERKDFRRYIYQPTSTGNIHSCDFDAEAQLVRIEDTIVSQGDVYHLNYQTTHRVVFPKDDPCLCTFVLRGPRERNFCHTYNTFYPERGIESSVPMMTPSDLKRKLEFVLEARK